MRTIKTHLYKINEHPNPEKVLEWIRNNWHDLNMHSCYELIGSLKELQKKIGGKLDYSIGCVPNKSQYVRITDYQTKALDLLQESEYPLTGVFWDYEVISGLKEGRLGKVLSILHQETAFLYSAEGLKDICLANEYEFLSDGSFFSDDL